MLFFQGERFGIERLLVCFRRFGFVFPVFFAKILKRYQSGDNSMVFLLANKLGLIPSIFASDMCMGLVKAVANISTFRTQLNVLCQRVLRFDMMGGSFFKNIYCFSGK